MVEGFNMMSSVDIQVGAGKSTRSGPFYGRLRVRTTRIEELQSAVARRRAADPERFSGWFEEFLAKQEDRRIGGNMW
jgi:hypothetical protein